MLLIAKKFPRSIRPAHTHIILNSDVVAADIHALKHLLLFTVKVSNA